MNSMQEFAHGQGHDYAVGSPHIVHYPVRSRIVSALQSVVLRVLDERGECRVLEVGAGHGTFTDHLLAAGAQVEVTEMSGPSAQVLSERYRHNPDVTVRYDVDGTAAASGDAVDLVVYMSVLHHIPDYLGAVESTCRRMRAGGAFVSFQDPLWYPRRSRFGRISSRLAYWAWRVPRGDFIRGIGSTWRQFRGALSTDEPSDMVEYHVVRDGVDEQALLSVLSPNFAEVELVEYWSTQGGWTQKLGARLLPANTFGVIATRYAGK